MDPRFARPSSPGSRRINQHQPFRSSTGTLIFPPAYETYYPPPRTSRETIITNPRSSADRVTTRVIPRVEAHQVRRAHDDYHVAPRRMTLEPMDPLPRRPLSIVNTTVPNRYVPILSSSVDPPASPASKSRHREEGSYSIQPASSTSRRDHSKNNSVDNKDSLERYMESGGPTRSYAIKPTSSTVRLVKTENVPREQPLPQRSGQIYNRDAEYRAGQPRRRESLSGRRERPMSMGGIEGYALSQVSSSSSRESGPPVTTRGFDKLDRAASRREGSGLRGSEAFSSTSTKDLARRSRDEPDTLNRRSSLREPALHQDKDDGYTSYREDREPRRHHHHRIAREEGKDRGASHSAVDLRLGEERREVEDWSTKHRDPARHRERDDGDEREHRPRKDREEAEERDYRSRRERDEVDDREHRSRREKDEGNDRDHRSRRDRDAVEERERRPHKDRDEKHERHHGSDLALGAAGAAAAGLVAEGIRNHRNSRDERSEIEAPAERKSDRRRDRNGERGKDRGESDTNGNSGDNSEERREKERRKERRREREKERERAQEREQEREGGSRRHVDERRDRDDNLRQKDEHHRAASFERGARPDRGQLATAEVPRKSRRSHKRRERREDQSSGDEVTSEEERKAIEPAKPLVRVVSPDRELKESEAQPKGILKKPKVRFPEELNPVREGVAPLGKSKDVPEKARWTRISRLLVNPEALEQGNERYEIEGITHVIVLRVLGREEIQQYADLTKRLREEREEKMHELRALEDEERKHAREPLALDNQPHDAENQRLALEAPSRNREPSQSYENAAYASGPNPPYPTDQAYPPNPNPPYPVQDQTSPLPYNPVDPYDPYSAPPPPPGQYQPLVPAYNPYVPAQQPLPQPYPLPTHQQPDLYAQQQQQIPGSFPPPPMPQGPYVPQQNGAMQVPPGQMPYGQAQGDGYGRGGQPPAGHF